MIRYLLAFGMLGLAIIAYVVLAVCARFDRTDGLTGDGQPEGAVSNGIKQSNHGERN